MKNKFIGFYNPTSEEIDNAWKTGVFAFDANALLNLYRYTESTRKDFIMALKTIKDKLFLPYQAAYEYHDNRLGVIEDIERDYDDLYNIFPIGISALFDVLKSLLERDKNISSFDDYIQKLVKIPYADDYFSLTGKGKTRLKRVMKYHLGLITECELQEEDKDHLQR